MDYQPLPYPSKNLCLFLNSSVRPYPPLSLPLLLRVMVSSGLVTSCLALIAPASGFVSPIAWKAPGAQVCVCGICV